MSTVVWRIELLGSLRVRHATRTIDHFRSRQTASLLAVMAHYQSRVFRREELVEMLWPEREPELGRNSLRVALTALRTELENPGERGMLVLADRTRVQLNPDVYRTDKSEF